MAVKKKPGPKPKAARQPSEDVTETLHFEWTAERAQAAVLLAQGYTQQEVADVIEVSRVTINRWHANIDFSAEVDRLSLMVDVASRAERLRIAMRVVREKTTGGIETEKDLLDWLKFAQSETDGIKLDMVKLVEAQGAFTNESDSS